MAHILIVEDDLWMADCYRDWLHEHTIAHAIDAQQALDAADSQKPALIMIDMLLPHSNGMQLLHTLRSYIDWMDVPVVLCSSSVPVDMPNMQPYGVVAVLDKATITPVVLRKTVTEALYHAAV
jgi:CheY-like chemotaxis protein